MERPVITKIKQMVQNKGDISMVLEHGAHRRSENNPAKDREGYSLVISHSIILLSYSPFALLPGTTVF